MKKSKKIRAFIYELITIVSFFTMVSTALLGREALINLYKEGCGTLTGKIYYLTEFREYISEVYTLGMLGYAGVGDDNGYPLTGTSAVNVEANARALFFEQLTKGGADLLYHIKEQDQTISKANFTDPLFSEYDGHLIMPDDVLLCCYWDGPNARLQFLTEDSYSTVKGPDDYYIHQYKPNVERVADIKLLIALKDTTVYNSDYLIGLQKLAHNYQIILYTILISGTLYTIFGLLCLITGKARRHAYQDCAAFIGSIWLECKLIILSGLLLLCYNMNLWYYTGALVDRMYGLHCIWFYVPTFAVLYLFLQDWSHNKGQFFQNSLLWHAVLELCSYFKKVPWKRKTAIIYMAYYASTVVFIITGILIEYYIFYEGYTGYTYALLLLGILLILMGLILFLLSKRLKQFISDTSALADKLADISAGISGKTLQVSERSLLKQAVADLNEVEHGIETAVEQNIRSNRMRVELITNVSHDLKTPLTSIINYADLLCEENLPAPAGEYAEALRTKAYRLKGMVQDVFELSKATSGNLTVEKTRLDLAKLLRQTLADMDERIQQSTLTFKLNVVTEPLMIAADGNKLYRVFQNLIINALQYSLENSRVYVQLDKQGDYAVAWIKNTSRQELDFDPDEIMERFVRADVSRTTEGSGLGLSIVQSFTEACGGSFSIEMNADLFIACVSFPLDADEPLQQTPEPAEEMIELCEEEQK
ncbi:MAG: HAMP domain-containing histidine kinase [Lachnospiraceae bacterium]|nr:HAMP domain-containing histidine kinase [Lachnospiraceae bacterium]